MFTPKQRIDDESEANEPQEEHAQQVPLSGVGEYNLSTDFMMLALNEEYGRPSCVRFVGSSQLRGWNSKSLGIHVEKALRLIYHYRYRWDLGRLAGAKVFRMEPNVRETFARYRRQNGGRSAGSSLRPYTPKLGWSQISSRTQSNHLGRNQTP